MEMNFKEALKNRRSNYTITDKSLVPDAEIEDIIEFALMNVPSAFNSQSTRIVLLLGENHKLLWNIVLETLRKIVKKEEFPVTETKINNSFAAGYGTVLFFEDRTVVREMQNQFPIYAEKFPPWSQHTSAMHQLAVWVMLEEAGFGASLQHYNPIIDTEVKETFDLPVSWELIAEMPFGIPLMIPAPKDKRPLAETMKVFR